jgi:D-alanyl-D-alanine dipeptidase
VKNSKQALITFAQIKNRIMRKIACLLALCGALTACGNRSAGTGTGTGSGGAAADGLPVRTAEAVVAETPPPLSPTARILDSIGLVDAGAIDPSIAVRLVYATADNFVGEVLYDDLDRAWLLPEAAEKLRKAQQLLHERSPGCRLIVYDAARPMSVQRKMRQAAVRAGKAYYVADPARGGGLHNYGAAVDVSILDPRGEPLPMGTEYDHLGPRANTDREEELVRSGEITAQERQNRLLLRGVMRQAGFRTVTSEWWHFNHCSRAEAMARYPLIDF